MKNNIIIKEIESINHISVKNALSILNILPELSQFYDYVQITPYNTVVIDLKNNKSFFSLEIGKNGYGYFFEKSEKLIKLIENNPITDISILQNDIQFFIDK